MHEIYPAHKHKNAIMIDTIQASSQAEARKLGLQHHMCLDAKNTDFVAFKQQNADQPVHASVQSGQCLCYSLSEK